MGVHGLSTYLRENKGLLFKHLRFEASDENPTNLVVDGWSFIYELIHCGNLDWVYGGEYDDLYRLIAVVVKGWLAVGLRPHFVFDGPSPPLKFGTMISRMRDNIVRRAELFFRTSQPARSHPRFLNENRILPPLVFVTSVEVLKTLAKEGLPIELYYADEEGDPYSVELAGKLNGYVTGTDSDFVVLNAEGYKGYIPMDDFLWDTSALGDLAPQPEPEPIDDFQPIKRKKAKKHLEVNHGIIPPVEDVSQISLTCTVISPAVLATHLEIPISLLPLLGALVGNDFSASPSARFGKQSLFFKKLTLSQRITRVSNTIRDTISDSAQNKTKKPKESDGVIDLIRRVVHTLLVQDVSSLNSSEEAAIIEKIVESALQYALPVREDDALRSPGPSCLIEKSGDVHLYGRGKGKIIRQLYLDGYHAGTVYSRVLDPLHTGTMWPRPFLENPEKETVHRSIGRPIREWIYAILDDGVGLPVGPEKEEAKVENEGDVDEEEGDDELIDVVEEDSPDEDSVPQDPLAPLKGALRRLSGIETPRSETPPPEVRKRKVVTEYVRRGLRIDLEDLQVGFLPELLGELEMPLEGPIQLAPESTRLHLFLTIIDAEEAAGKLRGIPPEQIIPALAVRWVVSVLYDRAAESEGSKDRFMEKWTRSEVKALLLAFIRPTAPAAENGSDEASPVAPKIQDRHVQLMAQVLASVEAIILLAQVLLLDLNRRVPLNLVAHFSGKRFHQLLNDESTETSSEVLDPLMDVVSAGLDAEAFADEAYKKRKLEQS
ncbi:hypothetical protein BDM02DRAFT_3266708 [Thelephora ganbajun]|uniref:Uncharacterized protein n=1 Tax=Thelephora ganbajun TaxID=370292 RepID=A0ACB6ZQE5_THEGA|nr:hypothetical protein BDM02DRAFT_3266708 [Thelephora ganbajun]